MDAISVATLVAGLGFGLGGAFGVVAERGNFCTMGGLSDYVALGDGRRLRAWILAMAVAILGTQGLEIAGLVELKKSIYLGPSLTWAGGLFGGALFGFGMTLTGGCANKTLVRLGGGSLKALVVILILGATAYMTLRGLIAPLRLALERATALDVKAAGDQGLAALLAWASGASILSARLMVGAALVALLLWFAFKDPAFRRSRRDVFAGLMIGLLVVGGWAATGIAGHDDFEPTALASLTFVGPSAEALMYLMTFTGASLGFGIAVVGGVVAGSLLSSASRGSFRLEGFADRADLGRHLGGAALMGVGGVLAGGCTIGQGLTGLSTLGAGSVAAVAGIVGGAVMGIRYLEEGSLVGAFRSVIARG